MCKKGKVTQIGNELQTKVNGCIFICSLLMIFNNSDYICIDK